MTLIENRLTSPANHDDLLSSWKEIATYLNRGIRTVQRWESELGLPVRRPRGQNRSAVIAMRSEIDQWLKACPVTGSAEAKGDAGLSMSTRNYTAETALPATETVLRFVSLMEQSQQLQQDMLRLRREVCDSIKVLASNVRSTSRCMLPPPPRFRLIQLVITEGRVCR